MAILNLVPVMTSSTTPLGVVTSSSQSSGANWHTFDDDPNTVWGPAASLSAWIQYEFDTAQVVSEYAITGHHDWSPKTYTLEGSDTGAFAGEETVLDTQTNVVYAYDEQKVHSFTNTTSYKYYRLDVTAYKTTYILYIKNIELRGEIFAEAAASVGVTATALARKIEPRANTTVSVTAQGEASITIQAQSTFSFVQSIQLSQKSKTFRFIQKIEQPKTSTVITRTNI